jgi:DNA invertase Pin-like site-specific DNA recombinase
VIRAAIYVRVSTLGQEDNTSLDTQEAACRAYCASQGYEIIGTWRETHSGAQLWERPSLTDLRTKIRASGLDVVVAYALDRLSRDQNHVGILLDEWKRHGVRMEFVTERFEDTAVGRFLIGAQAFAAELEREKIRERTMRGLKARLDAGLRYPGSKPKYGYCWGDDRKGTLEIREDEAATVRKVFTAVVNGVSLNKIAQRLQDQGIPTPKRRGYWRATTIRAILAHEVYRGQGAPAIVSDDLWWQAQQQLAINREVRSGNTRNWNPESVLLRAGHVFCGYCNNRMSVQPIRRAGKVDLYYACATRRKGGLNCPGNRWIPVGQLDTEVWNWLEAQCERLKKLWCSTSREEPNTLQDQIQSVDNEIARLRARGKAIRDQMVDAPEILKDDYRADEQEVARRLTGLVAERTKLGDWAEIARQDAERAKAALVSMHASDCTYPEKRRILSDFAVRVTITRDAIDKYRRGSGCDPFTTRTPASCGHE